MEQVHTVITGATGILGKALLRNILDTNYVSKSKLHLIASKKRKINVKKAYFQTKTFRDFHQQLGVNNYFDFAFLTRDKIDSLGPKKFRELNVDIIKNSVNLIEKFKPKNVILASSGAIYKYGVNNGIQNNYLYADLKIFQEEQIREACRKSGSNLIVSRIFNISGMDDIKFKSFALTDFIVKSYRNEDIQISSNFLVYRRYCDVNQLIELTIKLAEQNTSITFDSGGKKIEIRKLAIKVVDLLDSKSKILTKQVSKENPKDEYFSQSNVYEFLLYKYLNTNSLSIENQISQTYRKILKFTN